LQIPVEKYALNEKDAVEREWISVLEKRQNTDNEYDEQNVHSFPVFIKPKADYSQVPDNATLAAVLGTFNTSVGTQTI